jgi:PST family polysaccharide transporter
MVVIGGAQSINILGSIVRIKLLALMLGPAGVGLLSIYNNLHELTVRGAGLGLATSGVREVAKADKEETSLRLVRRTLLIAHFVQGGLAMIAVWLCRQPLATLLLGDERRATEIGLVGVAVLLALLASAQLTILQGLRRIPDLARIAVAEALLGSAAGLAAVAVMGEGGLIWFLLAQPAISLLAATFFIRRVPAEPAQSLEDGNAFSVWWAMVKLGSAFMLGGLAMTASLLLVRTLITRDLGLDAAGQFAAAWALTITYVGFLLTAMGADYYPRLAQVIEDRAAANDLINVQTQLGIAIGGPALLLLIGFASWVIALLYSSKFDGAVTILQWQTIGNILKLASWPLGFALVAAARSRLFFLTELAVSLLLLGITWIALPALGLEAAGIAFLAAYAVYAAIIYLLVKRIHGFRWAPASVGLIAMHLVLASALFAISRADVGAGAASSVVAAIFTGLVGVRIIMAKVEDDRPIFSAIRRAFAFARWPLRER